MVITGEMLVEQARTWLETPYHHAGRVKGPQGGVDCIGLIVGAARELGVEVPSDTTAYGRGDNLELMHTGLSEFCTVNDRDLSLRVGDIILFRGGPIVHHVSLYGGPETNTMIHVYNSIGKVVEQAITDDWERLLYLVYRLRAVSPTVEGG